VIALNELPVVRPGEAPPEGAYVSASAFAALEVDGIFPPVALLGAGAAVAYPLRNAFTGGLARAQARYVPRKRPGPDAPLVVVPEYAGTFGSGVTAEQAFELGGQEAAWQRAHGDPTLAATMGADAGQGTWWLLGANMMLIAGHPAAMGYEALSGYSDEDLTDVLKVAAAVARGTGAVKAEVMSPGQSRAFRALVSPVPPRSVWERFAEACDGLGFPANELATAHGQAAALMFAR